MSQKRRERRQQDPVVQTRKEEFLASGGNMTNGPLGVPIGTGGSGGKPAKIDGGGWGVGNKQSRPAGGVTPQQNPFNPIKGAGLTTTSQTFPSNFFVEWDLSLWRVAIDRVINMGDARLLATMYDWMFEASPFVQSLYETVGAYAGGTEVFCVDANGKELDEWSAEIPAKTWFKDMFKEIIFTFFDGFAGINFDPVNEKVYVYPQEDIDPINRILRASTYDYYNGDSFEENDNLLFVQPSTKKKRFCGWNAAISRSFININRTKINHVAAGERLAYPLMTVGYPQNSTDTDAQGNAYNPMKEQADAVIRDATPQRGLSFPYTIDERGNIVKSLEVGFESTGVNARAHAVYTDFNEAEKNEIREMVLGGTLTADVGNSGSRALGEVQERKLITMLKNLIEFALSVINSTEFKRKISKFYKNMPEDLLFDINRSKELTIDEITMLAQVLAQSGKRFTDAFFEANGLIREFFEDAPEPAALPKQKQVPPSKEGDISKNDLQGTDAKKKSSSGLSMRATLGGIRQRSPGSYRSA